VRSPDLRISARRISVFRALLLIFFAGLALRATFLTLFNEQANLRADRQILTSISLDAERGKIFDRNDRPLAISVDTPSVYALRSEVEEPREAAAALARILGMDRAYLEARLDKSKGGNFVFLKRWISPAQAEQIQQLELAGLGIQFEPKRTYPGKELAAATLGFTNIDGEGVRGVEQQADRWLRGNKRIVGVERDARGHLFAVEAVDPSSLAGNDLKLTIDARFQESAENALDAAIEKTGAVSGIVITLDPRTGEILALAERPTFDPNEFRKLDYASTRSRAFLDAYEPGSTMKSFLIATALDEGAVDAGDIFDCEQGAFRVPGRTIHDSHPHERLDVSQILQVSSNIGSTKIAFALGPKQHYQGLRKFGFAESTGSGFPTESTGIMRRWKSWRPVDHANIAFGQGINTTVIQLAAATAALANGGVWTSPRLIKARRAAGGEWIEEAAPATRRAISAETAATVLGMMETVVSTEGTARLAGLKDVRVSGKTGTAQKFDFEANRYSTTKYLAWFTGIVPADDPELVIITLLDEPQGWAHGGGDVAAPLFARVAAEQLRWRGVYTQVQPKPRKVKEPVVATGPATESVEKATPAPSPTIEPAAPEPTIAAMTPTDGTRDVVTSTEPEPEPTPTDVEEKQAAALALARSVKARASIEPIPTISPAAPAPAPVDDSSLTRVGERIFLPDLSGLSLAEVKKITADAALGLETKGRGVVISQTPAPGSVVAGGQNNIVVTFGPPRSEL